MRLFARMTTNPTFPAGKYVLYAEDDEDDRMFMEEVMTLTDQSITVVAVENGAGILDYLNNLPAEAPLPCFILLDINMPVLNGYQTIDKLKEDRGYRSLPVIFYSTASSLSEQSRALAAGAKQYIAKPFSVDTMKNICQSFARMCGSQPQLYK